MTIHFHPAFSACLTLLCAWGCWERDLTVQAAEPLGPPRPAVSRVASAGPPVALHRVALTKLGARDDAFASQQAKARARLRDALQRLDQFLRRGDATNRENWRRYLRWGQLERAAQQATVPSGSDLQQLGSKFFADHTGLQLAPFADVREALRSYYDVIQAVEDPEFGSKASQRIDELVRLADGYRAAPQDSVAMQIGPQLAWLDTMELAPELATQLRQEFVQSNMRVLAKESFIAAGLNSDVNETQPVRDVILGTRIYGWGTTVGKLSAELVPSETHARIQLVLLGQNSSTSNGYNGPVIISSRGLTQVHGRKTICVDSSGLTSAPATACCSTSTTICSISTKRKFAHRMIEKVAWRRAGQQKSQAEWIASRHAEARVARNMDERSRDFLAEANGKYEGKFRQALSRRRAMPQQMHFRTTSDTLQVDALHALPDQLGSTSAPPDLNPSADVTIQFHETFVMNVGEATLGGVKLTDERLQRIMIENNQPVPDELKLTPDSDPWSITFARQRPITFQVDGDQIRIGIRGQRFTRGDQVLDRLMDISAVYTLEPGVDGVTLTRVGDVEVNFPDREGQRLGVSEVTFRTLMRTKFSALFKEQIQGEGIELPGRWARSGNRRLQEIHSQDRWLALGWK